MFKTENYIYGQHKTSTIDSVTYVITRIRLGYRGPPTLVATPACQIPHPTFVLMIFCSWILTFNSLAIYGFGGQPVLCVYNPVGHLFSVMHCSLQSLKPLLLVSVKSDLLKKLSGLTSSKLLSILKVSARSALSCLVGTIVRPDQSYVLFGELAKNA